MRTFYPLCFLLINLFCSQALAHQMSTGFLNLTAQSDGSISGSWQLRWLDLAQAVQLDIDGNATLTWSEAQSQTPSLLNYLQHHLTLRTGATPCRLTFANGLKNDEHYNQQYMVAEFLADCAADADLSIHYQALFDFDQNHKTLVSLASDQSQQAATLDSDRREASFSLQAVPKTQVFNHYFGQGVVHIWLGWDHLAFLLVLLLTVVLKRQAGVWTAEQNLAEIGRKALWLVTAFTLAHSITLTATAMQWIEPNSKWVELAIAISVLLTALNNIWPLVVRLGWITFGFGLMHGMGFAGVLLELGLAPQQTLMSVVAFNLGVEAGQIAVLLVLFPLLWWLRTCTWYRHQGIRWLSLLIGTLAIHWSLQRL